MEILPLQSMTVHSILARVVTVLQNGGLIIYPTETCYGVGVDATNQRAVDKLLKYKERPSGKAISIAVSDKEMASEYVEINETAENLYKNFLPGPVTVISRVNESKSQRVNGKIIAEGIAAEDNSLGIRIPDYPFTLELIKRFGKPITATSGNVSSKKTPYTIADILDNASEKNKKLIDLIIDAGDLPHNPPSTVVDTRMNDERVIREGTVSFKSQRSNLKGQNQRSNIKTFISSSPDETIKIGQDLMTKFIPQLKDRCIIFALQGELGAGKTQFAKGVGKALDIKETINSPTFVLVKEYITPKPYTLAPRPYLYHIDTWRMQDEKELIDLKLNEMVQQGNVIVIEWLEKVKKVLDEVSKRKDVMMVWVEISEKEDVREIKMLTSK